MSVPHGRSWTAEDAARAADLDVVQLADQLSVLVREGVLRLQDGGYEIGREDLREPLCNELTQLQRRAIHGRMGRAFAASAAPDDVSTALCAAAHLIRAEELSVAYPLLLRALVRCTGNSLLETMVTSALDRHQRPLYLGLDVGLDAAAATSEHAQLVEALGAHDAMRARSLMIDHVSRAEERIVAALRAAGYQ